MDNNTTITLSKEFTIRLITEDLRNSRLLNSLERLGISVDHEHYLNIFPLVMESMGIQLDDTSDEYSEKYHHWLEQPSWSSLESMAKSVYDDLLITAMNAGQNGNGLPKNQIQS